MRKLLSLLVICCALGCSAAVSAADRSERNTFVLAPIEKRFIIHEAISAQDLDALSRVENASFELEVPAAVPAKSTLEKLAVLPRGLGIYLPANPNATQRKRLELLPDYYTLQRISKREKPALDIQPVAGPRRQVFVVSAAEFGADTLKQLKNLRSGSLRLFVDPTYKFTQTQLRLLSQCKLAKEIIVDSSCPRDFMATLAGIPATILVVRVHGSGPDTNLASFLSAQKGASIGLWVRGLVKRQELPAYTSVNTLKLLIMETEHWRVEESFVKLMNSRGEY